MDGPTDGSSSKSTKRENLRKKKSTSIPDSTHRGLTCDGCGQTGYRYLEIIDSKRYCRTCAEKVKKPRKI